MIGADLALTLPVAIPLATLVATTLLGSRPVAQRRVGVAGSFALLLASVLLFATVNDGRIVATAFGHWRAPFGIVFVADLLTAAMVLITGLMAAAVSVYALGNAPQRRPSPTEVPLYHGLLLGVCGSFLAGDLFNLYVWFEVMLIASFGLLVTGGSRAQLDAGVKYVTLNLVATTLLLTAVGLLYGLTGTLNLADLARTLPTVPNRGLVATLAVMLLLAFGAKAALFPLFFWLPAAYHTASAPIVAIFAALLTKVGVYAILRTFTLLFINDPLHPTLLGPAIGVIAAATMVTGVLGAAAHYDIRRILSFHIISQIGYMLVGLAVAGRLAIAGTVLYVLHHIVVKANLFLLAGAIRRAGGSWDLKRLGGLQQRAPLLAALFAVPALSLAGLPPLSGFWAKFVVVRSSLDGGAVVLATVALAVGALTLFSMLKIWLEAFWKPAPSGLGATAAAGWHADPARRRTLLAPIVALAAITVTIGVAAGPFVDYALRAADQLLDPAGYIASVLGPTAPPVDTGVAP